MTIPLHGKVKVLGHHPAGLWALDKASGVRSHPNGKAVDSGALLLARYDAERECYSGAEGSEWFLLNRLDAPTSGVILISDSERLAKRVRQAFAERLIQKMYFAVVFGNAPMRAEIWKDRLKVQAQRGRVRAERGVGVSAVTEMKPIERSQGSPLLSLLALKPKTGRTHQLRVQCAERRIPIVGDGTYGDFKLNRLFAQKTKEKRLFLHAAELSMQLEWEGELIRWSVKADLPGSFRKVFDS